MINRIAFVSLCLIALFTILSDANTSTNQLGYRRRYPLGGVGDKPGLENPAIDMPGYLDIAEDAALHRESHRLTEEEFILMSREPGTIILDARSQQRYDDLHIKGAINLSFPDITIDSLQETIPDKNTRILIYCNNNFENANQPFPSKMATASLNISTYIALYTYGYRNIYELGPLLDVSTSILAFESSSVVENAMK